MGCSGSKSGNAGGPSNKKNAEGDNQILENAGHQPLNKNQLKVFNAWFDATAKVILAPKEGTNIQMGQVPDEIASIVEEGEEEAHKKLFDQKDEDVDGALVKAEALAFLKEVCGEESPVATDEIINKWYDSIVSLNDATGEKITVEEFERSKQVMAAWMGSKKAMEAMIAQLPPAERAQARQAMRMMENMMGGMM